MLSSTQLAVVFFLQLLPKCDTQTTQSPCKDYELQKRVFPRTIYEFQGTQVVVVQRMNFTEDACKSSCLADTLCGGLFHDSRSSHAKRSRNGLCVLVPRTTLDKETSSGSNQSSVPDSPPVGVKSFAKVCRDTGKITEKPKEEGNELDSATQVNNVLYIYGGVTICLGTLMTIMAAFLFRKPPARADKDKPDPNSKVTLDINMQNFFNKDQKMKKIREKKRKKSRQLSQGTESGSSIMSKLFFRQNRLASKDWGSTDSVKSFGESSTAGSVSTSSVQDTWAGGSDTSATTNAESSVHSQTPSSAVDAEFQRNPMSYTIHAHSPPPDQVGAFVAMGKTF